MEKFFTGHAKLAAAVVLVLVTAGSAWYVLANREPVLGTYTVTSGDVTEALDEPATVAAEDKAGLSFQEGGQIADVYVKEGDAVNTGDKLADLDSASLKAGLEQADAAVATAEASYQELVNGQTADQIGVAQAAVDTAETALANATSTLAATEDQQDQAVANAYSALLNTSFSAVPGSNNDGTTATVTGTFNGTAGGAYAISIYETGNGLTFQASGLETATGKVQSQPTALGNDGLYIQFNGTPATTDTWTITIPNTDAATYTANENAYQAALKAQASAVTSAQSQVASAQAAMAQAQAALQLAQAAPRPEDVQKEQAAVEQARAAAAAAKVALGNALLSAPFAGTVQDLTAQVGQVVSPSTQVLSLINNSGLKIESYVSEADVAKVQVGDAATVTLDAFGTGTTFPATVTTVDSTETQVAGTPSYMVTLHFTGAAPQVSDGMTGNVHIVLAESSSVVQVPSSLVVNSANQYFVLVKTPTGTQRQEVEIGLVGSDGTTEITSGIKPGDVLVNF